MSYPGSGENPYGDNQFGGQPYGGQPYGGQPYGGQQFGGSPYGAPGPAPDNNLVWAILSTLFCCLPLGIVSIVKAASVNSLWAQGQYDQAHKASDDAKKFAMWAAIAGVVVGVLYFLLIIVSAGAGSF